MKSVVIARWIARHNGRTVLCIKDTVSVSFATKSGMITSTLDVITYRWIEAVRSDSPKYTCEELGNSFNVLGAGKLQNCERNDKRAISHAIKAAGHARCSSDPGIDYKLVT